MEDGLDHLAVDHLAIAHLQASYGDVVTRQAWSELDELFVSGCPVRLDMRTGATIETTGAQELGSFVASSIERFEFFLFTIQNSVVHLDPSGVHATGRLYIQELRQERDTRRWTTAFGLYRDRYRKDDGRWRFAARDYSSLARTAPDGASMETFSVPGHLSDDPPDR